MLSHFIKDQIYPGWRRLKKRRRFVALVTAWLVAVSIARSLDSSARFADQIPMAVKVCLFVPLAAIALLTWWILVYTMQKGRRVQCFMRLWIAAIALLGICFSIVFSDSPGIFALLSLLFFKGWTKIDDYLTLKKVYGK